MKSLLMDKDSSLILERSLKNISYLLSNDKFGAVVHKFLLRVC